MYTNTLLCAISLILYSMMISSGMSLMLMRMNSGRFSGVIRYKSDMSIVMNHAPLVDMTLLKRSLAMSMSAVGVATAPG
jgi:hypothetical protein